MDDATKARADQIRHLRNWIRGYKAKLQNQVPPESSERLGGRFAALADLEKELQHLDDPELNPGKGGE